MPVSCHLTGLENKNTGSSSAYETPIRAVVNCRGQIDSLTGRDLARPFFGSKNLQLEALCQRRDLVVHEEIFDIAVSTEVKSSTQSSLQGSFTSYLRRSPQPVDQKSKPLQPGRILLTQVCVRISKRASQCTSFAFGTRRVPSLEGGISSSARP
ncbi:hypothetical protein ARMSODRAFT_291891 [Armillaria solidipes]|uniref:Uncharacterized protein n=1 Tax=Armillaria solidipes TaxID=1076256 RepID=A0A2H3BVP6_9AGAR|nr:hypothetical protein ARMSODRAFT_291891 [Armillaria solidipes]